ncbi:MAG: hypothetical protein EOO14_18075, partial [Chitinophagaceae bacterium]
MKSSVRETSNERREKTAGNKQVAIGKRKELPKSNLACFLLLLACWLTACNTDFVQKERGYFKIDFPEKKYQVFDRPGFPYTFEYPVYGNIIQDSLFFD